LAKSTLIGKKLTEGVILAMLGRTDERIGCFIVCGFSTEFYKINPLIEYLKQQEYAVCCTAIAGQDTSQYRPGRISYSNWMQSVERIFEDFAKNCDILIVIGFSLGSILTFHLAEKYSIDALILINAPVSDSDYRKLLREWIDNFYYTDYTNTYDSVIRDRIISFRAAFNLNKMVQQLNREINKVMCPILIIQGKMDNMVKWSNAYILYENIPTGQKEIQIFPKSGHGICMDCECKLVFIRIHQFIRKIVVDKLCSIEYN